jgi:hypothetical protein
MPVIQSVEALLKEHEVAACLRVSVGTVRRWRLLKTGPRFIRVSMSAVRYRTEDLKAYVEARLSGSRLQVDAWEPQEVTRRERDE